MTPDLLKAFAIGICASVPIGPIAILVLQKSLSYGHKAGFATGLGATTVDTTYAIVSIFALAVAQNFLNTYETFIFLIGGIIVAALGWSMAFKDPFRKMKPGEEERGASIKDYLQAVATALSNPGAIFVMFALFAFFGVDAEDKGFRVFPIILAVAAGSMAYWFAFSRMFGTWRRAIDFKSLIWLNRIAGVVLMIIGIALVGEGLFELLFK
ncbi:MAG: LysE family transporter [Bacteroidales bacterium]|nr:LysE family transporter [Bacteroidales bacterium]MBQ5979926.1 LysE family transporter [Bacteroidales bacterium]MBQ6184276.1 LysE family transporter [Bacteroidales bacterium]